MEKTYRKTEEDKLEVVKTKEITNTAVYDITFLKEQLISIQEQKEKQIAERDAELEEVETLILECGKLNIVEKNK